jgi:WD40-like Beta Propeller Repeat
VEAVTRRGAGIAILLAAAACAEDQIGPPASISLAPPDTMLYVGHSLTRHDVVVGAYGVNRPNDDIHYWTPDSSIVSVTRAGVITGLAYGRARIVVSSGGVADTSRVSVVPVGTLAIGEAYGGTISVVELDGSAFRRVAGAGQAAGGAPAWDPTGTSIAFQYGIPGGAGATTLMVVGADGSAVTELDSAGKWPRFSRDGRWIYYRSSAPGEEGELWRITPDGTTSERIGPAGTEYLGDTYPDPSPSGEEVLLTSNRQSGGWEIVIRNVALGTDQPLGVQGYSPRWSPDGQAIAYWAGDPLSGQGAVYVMHRDGSGTRQVSPPGRVYRVLGLDWSPDGRWLVAQGDSTPELIDLEAGEALPLALPASVAAAWKR